MKSIFHALNRLKVFRGLTEQEFAWVLYDVGNSAFTMLSCSLIPIWFKSLAIGTAPGQINSHQATAYYSIAVAVVTVIVACSPTTKIRKRCCSPPRQRSAFSVAF